MGVDALGLPVTAPAEDGATAPSDSGASTPGASASGPSAALRARLDDPATAAALHRLLDHVDLLALLVVALDGLAARSEVIGESVLGGLDELRAAGGGGGLTNGLTDGLTDGLDTARRLAPLPAAVAEAAPAIMALLDSPVLRPSSVEALGLVADALVAGRAQAATEAAPSRLRLLRALRDDHVRRGLNLLVHTARALGRSL